MPAALRDCTGHASALRYSKSSTKVLDKFKGWPAVGSWWNQITRSSSDGGMNLWTSNPCKGNISPKVNSRVMLKVIVSLGTMNVCQTIHVIYIFKLDSPTIHDCHPKDTYDGKPEWIIGLFFKNVAWSRNESHLCETSAAGSGHLSYFKAIMLL